MAFLTVFDQRGQLSYNRHLHGHLYVTPEQKTIKKAAEVLKRGDKLWKILHDVGMSLLFGAFIFVVTTGQRHSLSLVLNKSLVDTFVNIKYTQSIPFHEVCCC